MTTIEIISLVVTIVCLLCFSIVFTILFRNYYLNNIEVIKEGQADIDVLDNAINEEKERKSKAKKVLKISLKSLSYLFMIFVLFLIGTGLYTRFTGDTIPFGDSTIVVIASGSMSERNENNTYLDEYQLHNQFDTYDMVGITKYKKASDVKKFDVVAFKSKDDILIVHRIIEVKDLDDGTKGYITRGDSNGTSDNGQLYGDYITYNDIVGYYNETRIPGIGVVVVFLQSDAGIITILAIIYCLIMFDFYNTKYEKAISERTEFLVDLIGYDFDTGIVKADYKETIIYKGNKYSFNEGKFVEKLELSDEELQSLTDENLVVVTENKNDDSSITITNTKTNDVKTIANATEEDIKEPTKFINKND